MRSDPGLRIAHLDLGILYAGRKDTPGAIHHLREAVRLDPSRTGACFRLARLYRDAGREPEAQAELAEIERVSQMGGEGNLHQFQPPQLPDPR